MTLLTVTTIIFVGFILSCVILGTYLWARFALPEKYAPLVIIPCTLIWLWLVCYGMWSFLTDFVFDSL